MTVPGESTDWTVTVILALAGLLAGGLIVTIIIRRM
jgi:hypothetical protein